MMRYAFRMTRGVWGVNHGFFRHLLALVEFFRIQYDPVSDETRVGFHAQLILLAPPP